MSSDAQAKTQTIVVYDCCLANQDMDRGLHLRNLNDLELFYRKI